MHTETNHHPTHHHHTKEEAAERFVSKHGELEIDKLFKALVKLEGSDLHLKVGKPPYVRVKGSLRPLARPH